MNWNWAQEQLIDGKRVQIRYQPDDPSSWHDNWTSYLELESLKHVKGVPAARRIMLVQPAFRSFTGDSPESKSFWSPYIQDLLSNDWQLVEEK